MQAHIYLRERGDVSLSVMDSWDGPKVQIKEGGHLINAYAEPKHIRALRDSCVQWLVEHNEEQAPERWEPGTTYRPISDSAATGWIAVTAVDADGWAMAHDGSSQRELFAPDQRQQYEAIDPSAPPF